MMYFSWTVLQTKNMGSSKDRVSGDDVPVMVIISLSLASMFSSVMGMWSHGSPSFSDIS